VDPALRDIYTARIAQRTGVRRETLERDVERTPPPQTESPRRASAPAAARPTAVVDRFSAERMLLKVLIADRARLAGVVDDVSPDHLRDPRHREIFEALRSDPDVAEPTLSTAARTVWAELVAGLAEIVSAEATYQGVVAGLRLEELDLRDSFLEAQLATCEEGEKMAIVQQKHQIQRLRGQLSETYRLGFKPTRSYRKLRDRQSHPPEPPE
jgi:hypothetical protein